MKMLKFYLLCLLMVGGCSFFVKKLDAELVNQKDYLKNIPQVPTYCPMTEKPRLQLINTNAQSQSLYLDFAVKKGGLDFIDHFALWTLLQMAIRPDQSSPSSRFQVLIKSGGQAQYLDFFTEAQNEQHPLLFGVDWILKKYKKKTTLEGYASMLDQLFPQRLKAGKNIETFLQTHQQKIKDHPILGQFFIRGTEVLKESEKLPHLNFLEVIRYYRSTVKGQSIIVNNTLTDFTTQSGQKSSCNYDFNLYDNSIFLIDKALPVANLFGLATENEAFMASTSQKVDVIEPLHTFPLFKGDSKVRSSAVCVIKNKDNSIWTFSNLSRDPGQHLFHLIRYGLASAQSTDEVDKLIRHSRHLFLSDPIRLVIESNRSRPDQIENLLKLNLPIYNADKLGNIWAYTFMNTHPRFIIDDRNVGSFSCK